MDLSSISSALTAIKTAQEIAGLIKSSDNALEEAEIKLKVADLVSALADAKIALADVREHLQTKEDEIGTLKDSLRLKENLVRHKEAYYITNENGDPIGDPYCSYCWESNNKAIHLFIVDYMCSGCTGCKTKYDTENVPSLGG
jgi:hypothetical protein